MIFPQFIDKNEWNLASKFLLYWYFMDIFLSLIIGLSTRNWSLFIFYVTWWLLIYVSSSKEPRNFILSAFALVIIEETIMYYLGGGLQGKATSLLDDYAGALPPFIMFILGWYSVLKRYQIRDDHLYILTGFHGFLVEMVFTGLVFSPMFIIVFGGGVFFIYASIILTPAKPKGEKKISKLSLLGVFIAIMILIIMGGVIASTLRALIES